jgi:hypothetical protein
MTNGKSKFNSLAISILMGLIIVAFAFTGVTSLTNTGNKVASVGDKYVEGVEFNRAYQGMVNNMTQRNGGKSLTQKQLKLAGVQQRVAEQLISQKLLLIFAESLHFDAGKLAIKNTILTQYPAFKTNGKFDIIKYKGLLKANGIQVKDFESDVVNQIKMDKLNALFSSMQFSNSYAKDFVEFRNTEAKVMAISFDKEAMTKNIKVAKADINKFLAEEKSKAIIDSLYTDYKSKTDKKKLKKIGSMKNDLAKAHLQKTKREDLKAFNTKLQADLEAAFAKNSWKKVSKLSKKYGFTFSKDAKLNRLNPSIPGVALDNDKMAKLFKSQDTKTNVSNATPLSVSIVRAIAFTKKPSTDEDMKQFTAYSNYSASQGMSYKALELQKKLTKVEYLRSLDN